MKELVKQNFLYISAKCLSDSQEQPIPQYTIQCTKNQIKYYANTPNTILYFSVDGKEGYFRECRKHLKKRQYLDELLVEYCRYVYVNENSEECLKILREKLTDKKCFYRFFNMGAGTANYTRITKFRKTMNSEYIGISKPYPEWFGNQLLALVQYCWGALEEYRYNAYLKIGQYHTYNANRTYCTKIIADMIGANNIIPKTEYACMVLDGNKKYGVVVGVAKGMDPGDAVGLGLRGITPEFQRQLVLLNLVDVISYQKDHRPGNYFVDLNENMMAESVSAFDNDCPTTLMCSSNISFYTYTGCRPLVENNKVVRPYLDRESVERILNLNSHTINQILQGLMSKSEIWFLTKRVMKLQKAIKKSVSLDETKLLRSNEWTTETINKEISGNYGKTYLKQFVDLYLNIKEDCN